MQPELKTTDYKDAKMQSCGDNVVVATLISLTKQRINREVIIG